MWRSFLDAMPRMGVAVAVVAVGVLLARLLRWGLERALLRRRTLSFARVMSKVGSWVFVVVVVLIAFAVTFPSVKPVDLLAGLGFFSVAVGFAFQDILENTLAGMLLLFRQPFRSGDQIDVVGTSGTVQEITIRETRITTYDGELVIIPNRDVYKNIITVHTHDALHRMQFDVGISYEQDPGTAAAVILEALRSVPQVAVQPVPLVQVCRLGPSTVELDVTFWTASRRADSLAALDAAIRAVKQRLEAADIELPGDSLALKATPSLRTALLGVAADGAQQERK